MKKLLALTIALLCFSVWIPLSQGSSTKNVSATNYSFSPKKAKIKKGQRVRWKMNEGTHNMVGSGWASPVLSEGSSWSRKFKRRGTFKYVCTLHPGMKGTVRVN